MRVPKWWTRRRQRDELAVIGALRQIEVRTARELSCTTGINIFRTYAVLDRLEDSGRVLSGWSREPDPLLGCRQRLYFLPGIQGMRADLVIIDDPLPIEWRLR